METRVIKFFGQAENMKGIEIATGNCGRSPEQPDYLCGALVPAQNVANKLPVGGNVKCLGLCPSCPALEMLNGSSVNTARRISFETMTI